MLRDLDSPKTKAIFAAARDLDALHRLWRAGGFSVSEIDQHITKLQSISVEHFRDSGFIRSSLHELRGSMLAKRDGDGGAEAKYTQAVERLDSEQGFQTGFI